MLKNKIMQMSLLATVLFVGATGWSAESAEVLQVGTLSYGGTGCPAGSAVAEVSADGQQLALHAEQLVARAGGSTGLTLDRKTCNLAIPIRLPKGLAVGVRSLELTGLASVPRGGRAILESETFFAGSQGAKRARTFKRGTASYVFTAEDGAEVKWLACGQDVILRVNASALVETTKRTVRLAAPDLRLAITFQKCD